MIELPVVAVLDKGVIEHFAISREGTSKDGAGVVVRGIALSSDAKQQLRLARETAHYFLTKPYVKPLAVDTLDDSRIVVDSDTGSTYEGPSFGLAFLVACLALGLDIPLREKQLYTAALTKRVEIAGTPGGGVRLGVVGQLSDKLAAACLENQSRIYLRSEDEQETLKFEQGFWREDVGRSCLPYALPETISTAAVVAMALDPAQLLRKIAVTGDSTAFLLLMFAVGGELYNGASLMAGIGPVLAQLRREEKLNDVKFMNELLWDMGVQRADTDQHLMLSSFNRCVAACPSDSMRTEVVKAIISRDPQLSLFTGPNRVETNNISPANSDLDIWLGRETFDDFVEFIKAPAILRLCSQLAPDFEGYWSRVRTLLLDGLSGYLSIAVELCETNRQMQARDLLLTLWKSGFVDSISRLNPKLVGEAKSLAKKYVGRLKAVTSGEVVQVASGLYADLASHQVPEVFTETSEKQQPVLTLTFRIADEKYALQSGRRPVFLPRPPLHKINNLELVITGPGQLSLCVPSPVLLVEHCRDQHYRYCRRSNMTLAEDTLNRYLENDAAVVRELFDDRNCNIVGFRVLDGEDAVPASVRWLSQVNPWPPAIDSQFLAASIACSTGMTQPRRLVDVGCGTGYLAIVAAHRWQTLEELHLVDIDALAVAAARSNVMDDPIAGELSSTTYWQGFDKFKGEGFDILLCAPPYLPERPFPVSGIEVSTNGTALLEEVVERGSRMSKEVWVVFSSLAWPEFQRALARVPTSYRSIEILRREFVPLRITWLEPRPPEDNGDVGTFNERRRYYEEVLVKRGLIDMDGPDDWGNYLQEFSPQIPFNCSSALIAHAQTVDLERILDVIKQDSRGYRFWHEVRVLRLTSASY